MLTEQELINLGLSKEKIQELIHSKTKDLKPKWQDELPKVGEEASIFSFSLEREKVSFETEIQYAFNTKFSVSILAKKLDLLIRMSNFALIKNDGWEADWSDKNSPKYGLIIYNNEVRAHANFHNIFVFGISFKTHEIADEAFNEFMNEIEEVFIKTNAEEQNHSEIQSTPIEEAKLVFEGNVSQESLNVADEIIRQNFKEFVKSRISKELAKKFCDSHGIDLQTLLYFFRKYNINYKELKIFAKPIPDYVDMNNIISDIQKGVHFLDLKKLYGYSFKLIFGIANQRGYFLNEFGFFVNSISENVDIEKANKANLLRDKKLYYSSRYLITKYKSFDDIDFLRKTLNKNYTQKEVLDFFDISNSAFYRICNLFDLPYQDLKRIRKRKKHLRTQSSVLKNEPYIAQSESVEKEPTEPISKNTDATENINQEEDKKEFVLPPKRKKWWQL